MNKTLRTAIVTAMILCGCSDNTETLYLYSWSDYIDPQVIEDFESRYECKVSITTFDSNEAAYAKLKSGAVGYDVMIPSSYIIPLLIKENIIDRLDHTKLPSVTTNFCHEFDCQICDPTLTYSVPYLATYTGIMYDKSRCDIGTNASWNVFATNAVRYSLLDDMREVIGVGLMVNGYSPNSENPKEITKATETILGWKKNICKFDAESYKTEVSNGTLGMGHGYSTDAMQVIIGEDEESSRKDLGFVLPKEGFVIAYDEMVVLKDSKNKILAHKFIDFMYETENSLKNMIYNFSPLPNAEAICKLPENYRNMIILDTNTVSRGHVLRNFKNKDTNELYNKAWDEIRSFEKCK